MLTSRSEHVPQVQSKDGMEQRAAESVLGGGTAAVSASLKHRKTGPQRAAVAKRHARTLDRLRPCRVVFTRAFHMADSGALRTAPSFPPSFTPLIVSHPSQLTQPTPAACPRSSHDKTMKQLVASLLSPPDTTCNASRRAALSDAVEMMRLWALFVSFESLFDSHPTKIGRDAGGGETSVGSGGAQQDVGHSSGGVRTSTCHAVELRVSPLTAILLPFVADRDHGDCLFDAKET